MSYLRTSQFSAKCSSRFLVLVFPDTLKIIPWKNYVRFWKCDLKRTPQSAQYQFLRKSNLKFCIMFNMISFANAIKLRLACSRVWLLITSSSKIVTNSNDCIKGDKYLFLIKVSVANVLLKLNYL